ncbi:general transcriptional corepressor trfA-like isoform X2 [Eriocheir sinensis]|uniref:general transcriptional corepressor trfA-like isoform X2 n=1 Tax=Eriocheir sinensis TaxID=95602 RepID=UPI0021C6B6E3|nr:general transcriptional corepressor trfA-like isoform X2 [Eriocheir sinensis]
MHRSEHLPKDSQRTKRTSHLNRNESLRSDKSERKVSFNKAVGVKHIPKGLKKAPRPYPESSERRIFNGNYTPVVHEPVSLDSKQLIEVAEDLVRVVDTVDCGSTPTGPYFSLERPGRGRHHGTEARNSRHQDYANIVVNPTRSRAQNNISNDLRRNNSSSSTLNNSGRRFDTTPTTTGTTTTTIPNNYYQSNPNKQNYNVRTTRNQIQKKTDVNRFQKSSKPLRPHPNSTSNPSLAAHYDHQTEDTNPGPLDHYDQRHLHKSVPDLRSTTYLNRDYDHRDYDRREYDQDPERYEKHYDRGVNQYDQGPDFHRGSYDHPHDHAKMSSYDQREQQRKVERIIQKFNQESTFFGTTPVVEPNDQLSHNNNQPFSYTRGRSPVRNDSGYTQVQRKRYSDDYTHRRWSHDDYNDRKPDLNEYHDRKHDDYDDDYDRRRGSNEYLDRKHDLNDYSAKIIITDERKYDYDDDHAYESYQIPHDLHDKTNSHDLNINMASVGVQTDQGANRGRTRSRNTPRQPFDHHAPSPRGRSYETTTRTTRMKPRNDLHDHATTQNLTSATLVRQLNHNFGRSDRSPSPPPRLPTTTSRPRYDVVPLLSDASDPETDIERPRDPLARIRTQVRARERQQEEEEEEESRDMPLRPRPDIRRSPPSYDGQMTPLTIDEVDALSLVMEGNKKSLVVATESSKAHTTSTTKHTTTHRTREVERTNQRPRTPESTTRKTRTPEPVANRRSRTPDTTSHDQRRRSTTPRRQPDDPKKKKKEEEEEEKKVEKKKKRKIKIKFFYDKPENDLKNDPLENFEEFKGENYDEEPEQRGTTSSTTHYASSSLGRPRGREKVKNNNNYSNNNNNNNNLRFSTLQQQSRSRRSSGSVSSSPTPRPSKPKQPPPQQPQQQQKKKPRYFGDTDIETDQPKPTSTTTTATPTATITSRPPPQYPGDYRSLPSRRIHRRRSPHSSSQHNSSESEVDSHASKASRVSTGSNRSVYLHATAVADIPVRGGSRQTDRQSDRQTDRQTKKVTRSFSLLSPWKPRHYRERYELDYERKTQLPPRPPRRPPQQQEQQQQQQQQQPQKGSKLSTWLRKKNKEAKGI